MISGKEARIKLTAEEWQSTFDSISDPVLLCDRNFTIVGVNRSFADIFKMNIKSPLGETCYQVVHGRETPPPLCPCLMVRETKKPSMVEFFEPHMGIHLEMSVSPVFGDSGDAVSTVCMAKDITGRKRRENALRESEEKYRTLVDNTVEFIFMVDKDNKILLANTSAARLLHMKPEEIIGKTVFDLFPEKIAVRYSENLKKVFETGTSLDEEGNLIAHGTELWIKSSLSPVRNQLKEEEVVAVIGISQDITERKQLEQKISELYKQEKVLREELEVQISRRLEFLRALVHELKTPITSVLLASDWMLQEVKEEPLLSLSQNIYRGISSLNKRADELLDFAKGEEGILTMNPKPVDMKELLQAIVDEVTPMTRYKGQSLHLETTLSLPPIWADGDRIRQVILNLLNNAFRFTPPSGKIMVRAVENETDLVVEVKDTGTGISKSEQRRLFDSYKYIGGKRKYTRGGLGLGLVLSRRLVELHGGRIWVRSKKGEGSIFSFSIPLSNAGQPERVNR